MATTTVTVNGFVRAPGTPVTDGNIAVFDTVTGELIADGGKAIAELTVDKSTGGNGAADAGKVLEFQAGGQIQGSADGSGNYAVKGAATLGGVGVRGTSERGYGVDAYSGTDSAINALSDSEDIPVITVKNNHPDKTAQLALFDNIDGSVLEIKNNGALNWFLPLAKQQTRVNMLPALGGNAAKVLAVNVAEDDVEWVAASGGGGGIPTRVINTQTGTSYTLAATDDEAVTAMIRLTNAGAIALTFPLNATVPIPVGFKARIKAAGTGQVTVTFAGATFVNSMGNAYKTAGQYAEFDITKIATDTWAIDGNLTT